MKPLFLKESNKTQIKAFFANNCRKNDIQGMKLQALYNLIQSKGEKMTIGDKSHKFNGLKALNIGEGFFIALKRTGFKKGSFYPCKLDILYAQQL
ncbi:MAG: hypothetical protein GY740_23950 [Gammaproteobacteria bacterium]|nr:hypothetical protein [Gammaproteobacteria bacterium]